MTPKSPSDPTADGSPERSGERPGVPTDGSNGADRADASPEVAGERSMARKLRDVLPPVSIVLLTILFIFAGWFNLYGPVNLLAWRGGEFPETEKDRPFYQQDLKDITRFQYENQPDHAVYFGAACGASEDDILRVIPPLPADAQIDEPRPPHGPEFIPNKKGLGNDSGKKDATNEEFNSHLDAFGDKVDCGGRWDAAFISFAMAASGIHFYQPEPGRDIESENFWLVTDVEQLMQVYRDRGAFFANPDFSPQVGDVIFYHYPGGLGVHANMIVAVTEDWITVGGDEFGKVGLASMTLRNRGGIVGYGASGYFEGAPLPSPAGAYRQEN